MQGCLLQLDHVTGIYRHCVEEMVSGTEVCFPCSGIEEWGSEAMVNVTPYYGRQAQDGARAFYIEESKPVSTSSKANSVTNTYNKLYNDHQIHDNREHLATTSSGRLISTARSFQQLKKHTRALNPTSSIGLFLALILPIFHDDFRYITSQRISSTS